jgi:DNA primase
MFHTPQAAAATMTTAAAPSLRAAAAFQDTAPSWEELQAMVEEKQVALDAMPADLETVRDERLPWKHRSAGSICIGFCSCCMCGQYFES